MSVASKLLVLLQILSLSFLMLSGNILATGILLYLQIFSAILVLWSVWAMKIGNFNVAPEVKKDADFVDSGPYGLLRNPMYTGLILFFGAGLLDDFEIIKFIVFLILLLVLLLKIRLEEKFLKKRFGKVYLAYMKKTYRLIPYIV